MPLTKGQNQVKGTKLLVGSDEFQIQNETTYRFENECIFGNYKKIVS